MIQRILTALVLIPLVLLLILRAPVWLLAIVAGIVALLAIREFLELTKHYGVEPSFICTYIFVGIFFLLLALNTGNGKPLLSTAFFVYAAGICAALAPFIFLTFGMERENLAAAYPAAAASVFAFTYIALPMAMLVQLRQQYSGAFQLIYLMFVVWSGDIFAYFFGKLIGRNKMSPRVSPGKTWEGAAASLLASVGIGTLLYHYALAISSFLLHLHLIEPRDGMFGLQRAEIGPVILLSALLNVAAQLGDLVESVLKRGAHVKDSGSILPGHGGMLDRIDAMLFAAPVLWLYSAWQVLR